MNGRSIGRMIARRLLAGLVTIACIYVVTFVMVVSLPGNPFQQGQHHISPEVGAALRARYSMDNNWLYFWQFLRGALVLDFGPTFSYPDWTCNQIIVSSLPVSALLGLLAILLAVMVGVPIGVVSAVHRDRPLDVASMTLSMVGISLPTFVSGSALLTLFAAHWKWAPVGGWGAPRHLVLPVTTLALPFVAYVARLTRAGMLDVLSSDFIRTALAKGLTRNAVVWRHALRVAFLPVLTYLGPATAQAMTGSFVVEKVFAVPGLGRHFVNAALNRDVGLVLATILVFSVMLVAFNVVVDVLYAVLDPRIKEAV